MQKFSRWQLLKWDMQRDWGMSFVRRYSLIVWAYMKLWWASRFVQDEFNNLLNLDVSAMTVMNASQLGNYSSYVAKVRSKIGGHGCPSHAIISGPEYAPDFSFSSGICRGFLYDSGEKKPQT